MKNRTIQQYNYHQWANERFFEHFKELPDEVYTQKIQSVFSSVEKVIKHIYHADGLWLSVLKGDEVEETLKIIKEIEQHIKSKNREKMRDLYHNLSKEYEGFIQEQDDLNAGLTIDHPKYGLLETTVADIVQHVVNHGTYHRGNITAMLRQQGHAGVPNDYIFFLYEKS